MKAFGLLMLLILGLSKASFAFEIGEQVLASCGGSLDKAVVIQASTQGFYALKYDNSSSEIACGGEFISENGYGISRIVAYQSVGKYTYRYNFGFSSYTYMVNDPVIAPCGLSYQAARILEISSNGYAQVKFDDEINQIACGRFVDFSEIQPLK